MKYRYSPSLFNISEMPEYPIWHWTHPENGSKPPSGWYSRYKDYFFYIEMKYNCCPSMNASHLMLFHKNSAVYLWRTEDKVSDTYAKSQVNIQEVDEQIKILDMEYLEELL